MEQEQALEAVEGIVDIPVARIAAIAFGGFLMGISTGYYLTKKFLEPKYEAIAEQEIAEAKVFYSRLQKPESPGQVLAMKGGDATWQDPPGMAEAVTAMGSYQGRVADDEGPSPEEITEVERNIFESAKVDFVWDHEAEVKARDTEKPYVVHEDEWSDGAQEGYSKITLTYYEGDLTLVDESDEPIPDIEGVIGRQSLLRFGHGTGDANTMFVRNERLATDFEVVRSTGKYAEEVLGLQHSAYSRVRHPDRFRGDGD